MLSFLLNNATFMENFWQNFTKKFSSPWIWYALSFAVLGITILILAKRIARIVKQKNNIDKNDGAYLTFVVVAILFLMAAVVLFVVMN